MRYYSGILTLTVLLLADGALAVCTAEHIAGNYASQFGPMACKGEGRSLHCCYENLDRCNKTLELELQDNGRELLGKWTDSGSSGAAKFSIDDKCNLVVGRWGTGSTASQRWAMSGRTSPPQVPAPPPAPKHYINYRGELLYVGENFELFRYVVNPRRGDQWCTSLGFTVSAEFDRGADFVFEPGYLHETLFTDVLPRLRGQLCPQASSTITANIYLKDYLFNRRGEETTRDAVMKSGGALNAPMVSVSYHADFARTPNLRPTDASQLNFLYNDTGVHRAHLTPVQVAEAVGSLDRLQSYYERGGKTVAEYAEAERLRDERQAAIDAVYQQVRKRYGTQVKNYEVARILAGMGDQIEWGPDDQWYFLRSYIQASTRICAERTVGKPYRSQSRFVDESGNTVRESDVVLWYSEALRPRVKGRQIGSLFSGVYEPDEVIVGDIARLVKDHGCASEPLASIERYFH